MRGCGEKMRLQTSKGPLRTVDSQPQNPEKSSAYLRTSVAVFRAAQGVRD